MGALEDQTPLKITKIKCEEVNLIHNKQCLSNALIFMSKLSNIIVMAVMYFSDRMSIFNKE